VGSVVRRIPEHVCAHGRRLLRPDLSIREAPDSRADLLQGRESKPTVYEPGSGVLLPSVIKEVRLDCTEEAKQAHLKGTVLLDCVVASSGLPATSS
jgi:hypothetical protein